MLRRMETSSLIDALRSEGVLLGAAAEQAGLTAPVPSCSGWAVRDLLLHVGGVHRWAATVVRERRAGPLHLAQPYDVVAELPADDVLLDWYRSGHADLVRTLSEAPDDLACWAFLPAPSPLAFWARRQSHETTVHRVDADLAAGGGVAAIEPRLAEDGVDELLTCFVHDRNRRLRADVPWTLAVHATDVPADWFVAVGPERPTARRTPGREPADVTVSGTAADLYLALWNRVPWDRVEVDGLSRDELVGRWAERVRVRWS